MHWLTCKINYCFYSEHFLSINNNKLISNQMNYFRVKIRHTLLALFMACITVNLFCQTKKDTKKPMLVSNADYPCVTANEAWKIGWPSLTGLTGNQLPLRMTTPLVENLSQARLVWVSKNYDLGSAKTGSTTFVGHDDIESRIGPDAKVHPGNWAGIVVSDGRVYGSSFRPYGKVFMASFRTNVGYDKSPKPEVPTRFRIEAEDLVICYDATTGNVLWQAVEPGGQIRSGGKRNGFQVAPAVDQGRIFAVGSTGRIFAYDAVSGAKLWQNDVGKAFKVADQERIDGLFQAAAGKMVLPKGPGWFTSLIAADGIVVTGDFISQSAGDVGLRGYDAATGELKWSLPACISKYATPNLWRHDGKAWLLCATASGSMRLINILDGQVSWKVNGLGQNWTTLAPGERSVMVNVMPTIPTKEQKRISGIWGCYRISPEKAEKAWVMANVPANGFSTWMDNGAHQYALIRDGQVLLTTTGRTKNEGDEEIAGRIVLLNEETGAKLISVKNIPGNHGKLNCMRELIIWLGEYTIVREDHSHGSSHGGRHPMVLWTTTPDKLSPIVDETGAGKLDLVEFTTGYEVLMHVPIVDGRIFERVNDGRLACYDLRQPLYPGAK